MPKMKQRVPRHVVHKKTTLLNLFGLLFFSLFAAASIHAVPLSQLSCEDLTSLSQRQIETRTKYMRIIAEVPRDAMGAEFQKIYGTFLISRNAYSNNLREIATDAFQQRLELAKKYKTAFANHMEPGWSLPNEVTNSAAKKRWLERWEGASNEISWSFGIKGHSRADNIFNILSKNLDPQRALEELADTSEFPKVKGTVFSTKAVSAKIWTFSAHGFEFKIFKTSSEAYFIRHASDQEIPKILEIVESYWRVALDERKPLNDRLTAVAKLEWLWFWANPFGRGGAFTGDILSIMLQRSILGEDRLFKARTHYVNQDLEALSRAEEEYVRSRLSHWKSFL